MKIYATSAQIAEEYEIEHELVIAAAINLPYSDNFLDSNVQIFEVSGIKIAQVTEAGYRAFLFHIDCDSHYSQEEEIDSSLDDDTKKTSGCEKILQWREKAFCNNALILRANGPSFPSQANNRTRTRSTISDTVRRTAEDLVSSGKYDDCIDAAFTEIHKAVSQDMGTDPGYQNVIQYVKARRIVLGK